MSEIYREPLFHVFKIIVNYLELSPLERIAYDLAQAEKLDLLRQKELIQYARNLEREREKL